MARPGRSEAARPSPTEEVDRLAGHLDASLEIHAPVEDVYDLIVSFEQYPAFLPALHAVRRRSPRRLLVEAEVNGRLVAWPAKVVEQRRHRRVAIAVDHGFQALARAHLRHAGTGLTELRVEVEYELDILRERLLMLLMDPGDQLEAGLGRFRDWVHGRDSRDAQARRAASG